jgi:hypothetical protein
MGAAYTGKLFETRTGTQVSSDNTQIARALEAVRTHSRTLLIGQVQSGKTGAYLEIARRLLTGDGSFTPKIVIILAGVLGELKTQTEARTKAEAQRAGIPLENCHVFLKNRQRLKQASDIARDARRNGWPVLLIDDESDQASPNTHSHRNQQSGNEDRSAVNSALVDLVADVLAPDADGAVLGRYLACTATPAANLLTSRTDILSCDAAVLLDPHEEYFGPDDAMSRLVSLPDSENDPDRLAKWSRLFVLYFFAGAALERLDGGNPQKAIRQVMVHVAQQTQDHEKVGRDLRHMTRGWLEYLANPGSCPKYWEADLNRALLTHFKRELSDSEHSRFVDYSGEILRELHGSIQVLNNKTRRAPDDDVLNSRMGLVGGNMLSRGITLPGLLTSGIIRVLKDSTPYDTVQQWMRFCGPRRSYKQYVTVLVTEDIREAFEQLVSADKEFRKEMGELARDGVVYLPEWRRSFLLAKSNITRASVQALDIQEIRFGVGWNHFRKFDSDLSRRCHNEEVLKQIVTRFALEQGKTDGCLVWNDSDREFLLGAISKLRRPLASEGEPYYSDVADLLGRATSFRLYLPGDKAIQERAIDWKVEFKTELGMVSGGGVNNVFSNQLSESLLRDPDTVSIHFRRIRPKGGFDETPEVMGAVHLPSGLYERYSTKRSIEVGNSGQWQHNWESI